MKKIITLFASVLLVASAFAQHDGNQKGYGNKNDRDVVYNDGRYNKNDNRRDGYSFSKRERDMQINRINREYDNKINAVRHKWFMNNAKKQRMIWSLEEDRKNEIREVYVKFNHPSNRFEDRDRKRNW
ncbi:MAG: hypothetical protein ABIN67_13425 [Ferruginibacter sp.]